MSFVKIKTNELIGPALDWAVAKCEGVKVEKFPESPSLFYGKGFDKYRPSTNWSQGGPIIERERLCVGYRHQPDPEYCPINDPVINCWARTTPGHYLFYGPTPLIAAMRCYVASELGDVVEIPLELAP